MPLKDDFGLKVSILESHAAQLRAQAMEFLFSQGEEYTAALDDAISRIRDEGSEHKRILGVLAEIGFCEVFCEAVQCSLSESHKDEDESCS